MILVSLSHKPRPVVPAVTIVKARARAILDLKFAFGGVGDITSDSSTMNCLNAL